MNLIIPTNMILSMESIVYYVTTQEVQSAVHNCMVEIYFGYGLVSKMSLSIEVKKKFLNVVRLRVEMMN